MSKISRSKTIILGAAVGVIAILVASCGSQTDSEPIMQEADVLAEVRTLSSALDEYPQHADELIELYGIVSEFEKTSEQIIAFEAGIQLRGIALTGPQIRSKIADQSARTLVLQERIRAESIVDGNLDQSKANYDSAKEQYRRALQILQIEMQRRKQIARKFTS